MIDTAAVLQQLAKNYTFLQYQQGVRTLAIDTYIKLNDLIKGVQPTFLVLYYSFVLQTTLIKCKKGLFLYSFY